MGCRAFDFVNSVKQVEEASKIPLVELDSSFLERSLARVARHISECNFGPSIKKTISPLLQKLSVKRGRSDLPVAKVIDQFLGSYDSAKRNLAESVHLLYLKQNFPSTSLQEAIQEAIESEPSSFSLKAILSADSDLGVAGSVDAQDFFPLFQALLTQSSHNIPRRSRHLTDALRDLDSKRLYFQPHEVLELLFSSAKFKDGGCVFSLLLEQYALFGKEHYIQLFEFLLEQYFGKLDKMSYGLLLEFASKAQLDPKDTNLSQMKTHLLKALEGHPGLKKELETRGLPLSSLG